MAKKNRKNRKPSEERGYTPLERLKRQGGRVHGVFSALGDKTRLSSFFMESLPNVLWAGLLANSLPREEYLELFRQICTQMRVNFDEAGRKSFFLCHNVIGTISEKDFIKLFEPILANKRYLEPLSPILLIECLPDRLKWQQHLPKPDPEVGWNSLASTIAHCIDHQSERSTDIRWLRVLNAIACDRLNLPERMEMRVEEILEFPKKGDLRIVRPFIRATEMILRSVDRDDEPFHMAPGFPFSEFWRECYEKTPCMMSPLKSRDKDDLSLVKSYVAELNDLTDEVVAKYIDSISSTGIDARLEGAFGLCFFAIRILREALPADIALSLSGRLLLRSLVEVFITLRYLTAKDDPKIWMQYRHYGVGQAKLSFLKNIDASSVPAFLDMSKLEALANEDMWMEYANIDLGAWADKNLRSMATEVNCKDVYDAFYDSLSGFSHGNWGAIRETSFGVCLNPLHRFHRMPLLDAPIPDVKADCCRLLNRMLDDLSSLYPSIKSRMRTHNTKIQSSEMPTAQA